MEPPRKHNFSGVRVKDEVELENGNVKIGPPRKHNFSGVRVKDEVDGNVKNLLAKRRRTEVSGSIVQPQQQTENFDMENNAPDSLPVEDSIGKDPMNVLNSCAVQNSDQENGRSYGDVLANRVNKLLQICKAAGWRPPSFYFEEQGPGHSKTFKCMVTVHMDGQIMAGQANTILECFSDTRPKKKTAKEHAAQGAIWFLKRSGYAN